MPSRPYFAAKLFSFLLAAAVPAPILADDPTATLDSYGGVTAIEGEATGFFHLEKFGDRHFLITPEGHGYRALGINHFHNMTSSDYDGAVEQIKAWGFNAGCYQGPRWMWKRYPYTKGINLVPVCVWKPASQFAFKDIFDADVLSEMEAAVRKIVEPQANNEMLIGYFWTDIPIWSRTKNGGWIAFYKSLPKSSAGGAKWQEWKSANPEADENDFLVEIAKQLYAKGHEFVRKYDQNHLIFGDRYHEVDIPEAVVREALPYIDAISIQPTSREFNFDFFDRVYEQYGKPLYIADHVSSFPTEEHPITMGRAAESANAYSDYYERYVTAALSRPYMIGFNKCQYQDEPGPKLLKQGLLKVSEKPYSVVERVAAANVVALKHAYADTQPTTSKSKRPKTQPSSKPATTGDAAVKIVTPSAKATFSADDEIVIKATANLDQLNGRRVSFYYLDEKWKPIGHDDTAPFEATWKSPPSGTWDVYVAVHGQDWKIVSKSWVQISVRD